MDVSIGKGGHQIRSVKRYYVHTSQHISLARHLCVVKIWYWQICCDDEQTEDAAWHLRRRGRSVMIPKPLKEQAHSS